MLERLRAAGIGLELRDVHLYVAALAVRDGLGVSSWPDDLAEYMRTALILSLVGLMYADASGLEGTLAVLARGGVPVAALLMPAGFFFSRDEDDESVPLHVSSTGWSTASTETCWTEGPGCRSGSTLGDPEHVNGESAHAGLHAPSGPTPRGLLADPQRIMWASRVGL